MSELDKIKEEIKDKGISVDEKDESKEEKEEDEVLEEEIEEEGSEEEEQVSESEFTEEEIQAQESGWRPKDDWDGDPDEWVTARQFLRNGEFLKRIHNQNRKLKQLEGVVDTMAKQHRKMFDSGYEKAKREIKAGLRQAIHDGDENAADAYEERLEQLETAKDQEVQKLPKVEPDTEQSKNQIPPEFVSWVKRNDWFTKYPEMRAYAEMIGVQYAQNNPEYTNVEVYSYVTDETRKRFPERFGITMKKQSNRKVATRVEGAGDSANKRVSPGTKLSLTQEEREVGRTLVKRGLYKSMSEYAVDLNKLGVKS